MKVFPVIFLVIFQLAGCSSDSKILTLPCSAPQAELSMDHVVIAVRDLSTSVAEFSSYGFTSKPGRLHANGLLNAHLKFGDGTELELMSVQGDASDAMAQDYESQIEDGGGGVFLALGANQERISAAAASVGVDGVKMSRPPFHYVTFNQKELTGVFAIEYEQQSPEESAYLNHANGAQGIREGWVEAGKGLIDLLLEMGARECGPLNGPFGEMGTAFAVKGGTIVVVAPLETGRPHVLGVRIQSNLLKDVIIRPQSANGFWIQIDSSIDSQTK